MRLEPNYLASILPVKYEQFMNKLRMIYKKVRQDSYYTCYVALIQWKFLYKILNPKFVL